MFRAICNRSFFLIIFLPMLLVIHPAKSFGQRYHIQTFREQDGVASNAVNNAAQDSLGNVWFATRVGLTVFDGIRWQTMDHQGPGAPTGEGLVNIDDNGVVWWVNKRYPFAVSRLKDGRWEKIPNPPVLLKFTEIMDIRTWIGPEGDSQLILAPFRGDLHIWRNGRWFSSNTDLVGLQTHSLALDGSRLLVSSTTEFLSLDLKSSLKLEPVNWGLPPGQVLGACTESNHDKTWIVAEDWVALVKNGKLNEFYPLPGLFQGKRHHGLSVCTGPNGGIYFADYSRVFYFHALEGLEVITPANGLATDGGNQVMLDRENIVWICSTRGISKIVSRRLACYSNDHGLLDGEVSSIIQRASGEMVLGQRRGLSFFGPEIRTLSFGTGPLVFSRVTDLAEDAEGRLWIAANHQGLGLLGDDDTIKWYGKDDGLGEAVYAVLPDAEHGLFAGTARGLFRMIGERFEPVDLSVVSTDPNITIRRILPLSTGGFVVTSRHSGLFFWKNGIVSNVAGNRQDGSENVFTVYEHSDGRLWVGTNVGLFLVDDGKLKKTTAPEPVISRPVYSIIKDEKGHFWFGTDNGVTIWDGEEKTRLTTRDGLLGTETNRDALLCNSEGHIWIGTDSGLSVFRPEYNTPPTVAPILILKSLTINGHAYPTDKPLHIEGPLASLVFIFHASSFASEDPLRFSSLTTSQSSIEAPRDVIHWPGILPMTNVPPGKFQVQITGHSSNGLMTNTITTPLIVITKPLKDRWYSRALAGVAFAMLVWLLVAYYSGRRYARRLEEEVRDRTRGLQHSEETARLESERLKSTLESISDGVVVVDGQCNVLLYNSSAEALFAHSEPPQSGCPLVEILPVSAIVNSQQADQYQVLLSNPSGLRLASEQVAIKCGNDQICWLEISAVPITGSPGGVVFAFRDITNRLQTERNERRSQKLESLGLLAGGIAHDFNNLLTIMMGNLSLAESTLVVTATEAQQLDKIRQASSRAQNLTRQLITFAKGGGPVLEKCDIAPIIHDSVTFNLSGSNIDLKIDLAEDLLWTEVDADQIFQVIGNLVINARQAMSGGGQLIVSAMNSRNVSGFEHDAQLVTIQIEDNGVGISEKAQARIFDPYFSTKERGTGLGLAIAHSIVTKHNGQLTVESVLGKGSRFCLILPACPGERKPVGKISPLNVGPITDSLKILFMDDEEDIRTLLGNMLEILDHQGTGVSTGEEAREVYAQADQDGHPFDIVILDLTIPGGMGGLEALSELRKINPQVKVIVASGYSDAPVMAGYEKFGFSGILNKPFSQESLEQVISKLWNSP